MAELGWSNFGGADGEARENAESISNQSENIARRHYRSFSSKYACNIDGCLCPRWWS